MRTNDLLKGLIPIASAVALQMIADHDEPAGEGKKHRTSRRARVLKTVIPLASTLAIRAISTRERSDAGRNAQLSQRGEGERINLKEGGEMRPDRPDRDGHMTGFIPGLMIGGLIGGLIGAAAALLFAPRSGDETQDMLRQEAIRLKEQVKQQADEAVSDVRSNLETASEQVRATADRALNKGERFVGEQADKLKATVDV